MKIVLTPQESEQYFYLALCNGLDYVESGYGLDLLFSRKAYNDAKVSISNLDPNQQMSHEDLLMQILRDGGTLNLYDMEAMEDNIITLADVHERVATTQLDHLMDMIAERDDAVTADVIIQTVFLKEIVFG
jgi:hypothetical protein